MNNSNHSHGPSSAHATQRRQVSILLVDDNPDHATLAAEALGKNSSWTVDLARTLASAFEMTKSRRYDALLIDYCLPDGYGLDIIDWVRDESAVVVMTGMGNEEVAAEAFKSGAQDYLVKNALFSDVLADVLQGALDKFQGRADWRRFGDRSPDASSLRERPGVLEPTGNRLTMPQQMIDTLARIRMPISQALNEAHRTSDTVGSSRLQTALARCDELAAMIKHTRLNPDEE